MRSTMRLALVSVLMTLPLCLVISSAAQQITFEDFSDVSHLQFNGSPHQASWNERQVLRLTDGATMESNAQVGTAYFNAEQPIAAGFTTWFEFQAHAPFQCCFPGDGIAFIVQNTTASDPTMGASGTKLHALGAGNDGTGGGMGYAGLNNSLAIEFDPRSNAWDPPTTHVAVQSCGATGFNTPVHVPGDFTIGGNNHVESCLLFKSNQSIATGLLKFLGPGPVNTVVIDYTPPSGNQATGILRIWLDPPLIEGTHTPTPDAPTIVPPIAYTINDPSYGLALDKLPCRNPVDPNCGFGYVGFTASQPDASATAQDIVAWEYTPHTPVLVSQQLQNGGTTTQFPFGGHIMDVTYPQGFINNCPPKDDQLPCYTMTVVANPIDQATFKQRLLNTQFAHEQCVRYLQTGNNCILYTVTCHDQNNNPGCPTELNCDPTMENCITIQSSFTTTDPVTKTNADFLEAEPSGSNKWFSICFPEGGCYDPNSYDGIVSGMGQGFSDIVATFQTNKPVKK